MLLMRSQPIAAAVDCVRSASGGGRCRRSACPLVSRRKHAAQRTALGISDIVELDTAHPHPASTTSGGVSTDRSYADRLGEVREHSASSSKDNVCRTAGRRSRQGRRVLHRSISWRNPSIFGASAFSSIFRQRSRRRWDYQRASLRNPAIRSFNLASIRCSPWNFATNWAGLAIDVPTRLFLEAPTIRALADSLLSLVEVSALVPPAPGSTEDDALSSL